MIDDYQQIISSLCLSLPDKTKIVQPMSRKAKRLLAAMLEWSRPFHGKIWRSTPDFMRDFYPVLDPLQYEDICRHYKIDHHLTEFKKAKYKSSFIPGSHKTTQEVLDCMQLKHFQDLNWVKESALLENIRQVGDLTSPRVSTVYYWLANNFLITDFTEDDLNRIVMLGDDKFDFELIKREASKIQDVDKRSMAYLYAIIKDVTIKEEWARQKSAATLSDQEQKLQKVVEQALESTNKLIHQFPSDIREQWEHDLVFLNIARDLKNDSE